MQRPITPFEIQIITAMLTQQFGTSQNWLTIAQKITNCNPNTTDQGIITTFTKLTHPTFPKKLDNNAITFQGKITLPNNAQATAILWFKKSGFDMLEITINSTQKPQADITTFQITPN